MLPRRRCPFCRRWFHPHPRLKERQKTFRYRLFFVSVGATHLVKPQSPW